MSDPRIAHDQLLAFNAAVLEALGVPPRDAFVTGECLALADLRGIDSHGSVRLPVYGKRIEAKVVNAKANVAITAPFPSVALVDGDNGLGPVVGTRAMEHAIRVAETNGVCFVGVRNSNHFGAACYYVEQAVRAGLIALAFTNAPPNMAPHGGRERFLGTNPIAAGIPAGQEPPIVFDASTAVAARGKIINAMHRGESIPEGWAIDPQGNPTTDAKQALLGAVLPFAGPKGSAISFLIDIACGVLTGAAYGVHLNTLEDLGSTQNVGHAFAVFRTDLFLPEQEYKARMDDILRMLKQQPAAPGVDRVLAPGEVEFAIENRYRREGIPFAPQVVDQLVQYGKQFQVPFPLRLSHDTEHLATV